MTVPVPGNPPAGPPAGFPQCGPCPYVRTGPVWVCAACASRTFEHITQPACQICDQILPSSGICPNWLCSDPNRKVARIRAIAYHSGPLRKVILDYKYNQATGWALIFGRLVVGWLDTHPTSQPPELIVANPTYTEQGCFPHTETVLQHAANEDMLQRWPFDIAAPRAVVKTGPTPSSAGSGAAGKRAAAAALRSVLSVPDPSRTQGRRILIYDDVCTTGSQLNMVADCLLSEGGAAIVEALVLARAPWR